MEEEMFAFFPNGIRALLVDDNPKFLKSAATMLSLLNFKVATCGSPSSALRLLTSDSLKDVDVVLSDAHKVATCGFNFRGIIEPDLRIPVIYVFSPETPIDADDMFDLLRTIHTATYVIKKPLDAGEVVTLWRVVAWRKILLHARMAYGGNGTAPAVAGGQGGSLLPLLGGASDDDDREEGRVHFKVVKPGGSRKRRNNSDGGAGSSETQLKHRVMWTPCLKRKFERAVEDVGSEGYPSKILEHMNVEGLERSHVASYLQKYRKKQLKKNSKYGSCHHSTCSDSHPPEESLFVQAVLQTLKIPRHNSQIFADATGPSNVAAAAAATFAGNDAPALASLPPVFQKPAGNVSDNIALEAMPAEGQQSTGSNDAPALAPLPPVFQQHAGNTSDNIAPVVAMPAEGQQSFGCNDAPAPAPWLPVFQQPAENVYDNIVLAAAQQYSGGQVAFPQLLNFFGPFTYQGPPPPAAQNMLLAQGEKEQQREAEIQPPHEQPMGDVVAGATADGVAIGATAAAAATHAGSLSNCASSLVAPLPLGAAPSEAALEELFNIVESLVAPPGDVALASEEDKALMEALANSAGPFVVPRALAMPAAEENVPAMGAPDNINGSLLVASSNGPAVASGEGELAPMVAADEDIMFPLDALMGLDMPMDIDGSLGQQGAIDAAVAAAAGAGDFLNDEEGGIGNWYLGTEDLTPLGEIFKDTTGDFMMLNYMTERE